LKEPVVATVAVPVVKTVQVVKRVAAGPCACQADAQEAGRAHDQAQDWRQDRDAQGAGQDRAVAQGAVSSGAGTIAPCPSPSS
ncbi:hypothetical protein, partial [Ralstonia pseudosolanacearum]|uniref:hypothetical protein n=1 Tax=Ralstonia pseudosolanacearum TaxID=1310165 RepID=UPI003CE87F2C